MIYEGGTEETNKLLKIQNGYLSSEIKEQYDNFDLVYSIFFCRHPSVTIEMESQESSNMPTMIQKFNQKRDLFNIISEIERLKREFVNLDTRILLIEEGKRSENTDPIRLKKSSDDQPSRNHQLKPSQFSTRPGTGQHIHNDNFE